MKPSSAQRLGADLRGRRELPDPPLEGVPEPSSLEAFVRRFSAEAHVGFPGSRFLDLRLWPSGIRTLPGAAGEDRQLKLDIVRPVLLYFAIFRSATSSWYNAESIRELDSPFRYCMRRNRVIFLSAISSLYGLTGGERDSGVVV